MFCNCYSWFANFLPIYSLSFHLIVSFAVQRLLSLMEKEMANRSSTLAWKIPWTEEFGAGYCPWGRKESDTTERLHFIVTSVVVFFAFVVCAFSVISKIWLPRLDVEDLLPYAFFQKFYGIRSNVYDWCQLMRCVCVIR